MTWKKHYHQPLSQSSDNYTGSHAVCEGQRLRNQPVFDKEFVHAEYFHGRTGSPFATEGLLRKAQRLALCLWI